MITIKKNESFPGWIQIFAFGNLVEEVEGRAKALRVGKKLAKKNKLEYVLYLDKMVNVD
jgi:hypothetical protein